MYEELDISGLLRGCYPAWLTEFREMDALLRAQEKLLEQAAQTVTQALGDQCAHLAREEALAAMERFLGIAYEAQREEESRRDFVASHFVGNGRFGTDTVREIAAMFTPLPCNVAYTPGGAIRVEITHDGGAPFFPADCTKMLNRRKPAHLELAVTLVSPFAAGAFYGTRVSEYRRETVRKGKDEI